MYTSKQRRQLQERRLEPAVAKRDTKVDIIGMGMFLADQSHICFAPWQPDLTSANLPSPGWTKMILGDYVVCNSLEWTTWDKNPIQVLICEDCGTSGCKSGGYVELSKIGDHLLWTDPTFGLHDEAQRNQLGTLRAVSRHGALAFSIKDWQRWQEIHPTLPKPENIPVTTRRQLAAAWLSTLKGLPRIKDLQDLPILMGDAVVNPLPQSTMDFAAMLRSLVLWVSDEPEAQVAGMLSSAECASATVLSAYYEGTYQPWLGLALMGTRATMAFGAKHILLPAP